MPTDKPSGSSTTWLLVAGVGAAAGVWWYRQSGEDAHAERLKDEERLKKKARELKEAGKTTAHDAVREGQQGYDEAKVRAARRHSV